MIVNVRTKDDLLILLRNRESGNWKVGATSEPKLTKVRVFNWDATQVLKGDYDPTNSIRDNSNRLIIGINNCRIENFEPAGSWAGFFGAATVVYTEEVSIQNHGFNKIGIVRGNYVGPMTKSEVDDYFERLKKEILLRGLNKIVFQGGGTISIPDFFSEWCNQNGVDILILNEDELNRLYHQDNDLLFEETIFDIIG
jgi:hypothetical protein